MTCSVLSDFFRLVAFSLLASCRLFPDVADVVDLPLSLFFGVVGDVPAGALELNRRRREQLTDRTAAGRAHVDQRIGEFLNALEPLSARFALVLV